MKKILLLIVFALVLTACVAQPTSVQTSSAVQVSDAVKVAINGLLLTLVMYGLQLVFDLAHIDLRGIGVTIAAAVSEFAILQLQGLIDTIPAAYDPVVTLGLEILLAVLVFLGGVRLFGQRERAAKFMGG